MRVLNLLSLQLILFNTLIYAQEDTLNSYISNNKQKQFGYDYEKNIADNLQLRDSWIAPLSIDYSYIRSKPYTALQTNQNASIKINQPIFKSGGIYYGIRFAQMSKKYANLSVKVAKRKMIKDAISLLMQIKVADLGIQKQKLQIKNSKIKLEQKKEQYLDGQLDSGFLDNAIIDKNRAIETLYDLQTSKERLISQFKTISDKNYKNTTIPYLKLIDKQEFLKHNVVLKLSKTNIEKSRYAKDTTVSKYLPQINFVAGYNWQKTENQQFGSIGRAFNNELNYYNYGFTLSMPININTFRDIESTKLTYLKSQVELDDKKRELLALFEQVMQNIDNYEKKIYLSDENIDLYLKLLKDTKKLYKAGYKTEYDVDLLTNSLLISKLDYKIFEVDKQMELLNLYEMYESDY